MSFRTTALAVLAGWTALMFAGAPLLRAAADPPPQDASPATQRFRVDVSGAGPDVVLIPGLASSGAVWDATAKTLAPRYRVHVVQIAGFAGLPAGPNAEGEVLAPIIRELADYVAGLDRPALIGHSLGGLAALEIAAARPDDVGGVLVADALPFYPLILNPGATVEMIRPQAEAIHRQILGMDEPAFARGQKAGAARLARSAEAQSLVLDWSLRSDRRVLAQALLDDMITDARPSLSRITTPVTVVYAWDAAMGAPTTMLDGLYAGAYAGLGGVKLRRIDGAFHFLMLDQPEAFAEAVADFLRETPPGG